MSVNKISAQGVWKEVLALFFPVISILFMGSVVGVFERLCLAHHSLDALNVSVQALCALQFFQLTCVVFANMTQIFVGEYLGANEATKVGNCTWQMIWISILSMLIILPLSFTIIPYFFKGIEQRDTTYSYFKILISGNFLFPLGATLSAFFFAQDKRWVVVLSSLGAYSVNLILDVVFILGIPSFSHPMGALGAAWSGLITKFVFCLILFLYFLKPSNRELYNTHLWRVKFSSILTCLRVCTPRAVGKAFAILIWTATMYLMVLKGKHYLSILSVGSTLTLFCCFLSESLVQSLSVIISRYLGAKEYLKLWKSWRFGFFFALIVSVGLAVPFLFFPDFILSFFFSELPVGIERYYLQLTVYWVWFWVFFNSLNAPLLAFLLAAKDTVYYMVIMSLTWVTSYLPIYYCLYRWEWSPDKFWLILVFDQLIVLLLNSWRVYSVGKAYRQIRYEKQVTLF